MANESRAPRDLKFLLTAAAVGIAGFIVVGFAFGVPLYRHIVYGTAPAAASSFAGFWGLFALFGSAATLVAFFQAKEPTDRGPRGGHRIPRIVSADASRCPASDGAAERERRAA
jgi:hypothetical protein